MALVKPSGGFESCIRLMELEQVYQNFGPVIKTLVKTSSFTEQEIKDLISLSWEYGYEFRKQEEELNKGASF